MKRHHDAIAISDGSCNPRAIINAMVNAQNEITDEGDTSTVRYLNDPALKLMLHQLAFLMGIPTGEDLNDWSQWRDACHLEIEKEVRL